MFKKKVFSGFTEDTAEKLLLDAGAFFKNFIVGTDTFDSAVSAGKLVGATQGGGTFSAIPTIRKIEIDGVKGAAKGLEVIDEWVITLAANVKEISEDIIVSSLAAGRSEAGPAGYQKITASNYIELSDYIDNITWVGKLSGSDEPVIIQVFNALSTSGLSLQTQDKNEAVIAVTFTAHYGASELDTPPFDIYYPKSTVVKGSVSGTVSNSEGVVAGAIVSIIVGSLAITNKTGIDGTYVLNGVPAGTYVVTAVKGEQSAVEIGVVVVADVDTSDTDLVIA